MQFTKLEALGNDFVLIDERDGQCVVDAGSLAVHMCHRTAGAGADGLLIVGAASTDDADVHMRIFNADGSEAEVSGNGTRCVARYLASTGEWPGAVPELRVATAAGVKRLNRVGESLIAMDMGRPSLRCGDVPFNGRAADENGTDVSVEALGRPWTVTVSSIGNPHCSIFVNDFESVDWKGVGAALERHASFPNRVNVEFVRVVSRELIDVRFWERGVGETGSSGTGASAATVASIAAGKTDRRVTVRTASGDLTVEWPDDDASLRLTGPARVVYRGEWLAGIE